MKRLTNWFRKTGKSPSYVNYSATLLTSLGILGILGTFIGIVVGLLEFNAEDIDGSIGLLLAGLKTAFITSLVGMSASIIFKVLGTFSLFNQSVRDPAKYNSQQSADLRSKLINQYLPVPFDHHHDGHVPVPHF
ncbi:MotA/TolQ/ExbB proton channel family protein [Methyloprofundus sp.]|uniref:MotA/TolQ/ExbB proton channel family protein n=1 Tax=Methyloprofundus sp. TaxID=2020875 RepID=UPI003D0AC40C